MQLKPKNHQYMGMNWTKLFEKYVVQLCWSTEPSGKKDFIDQYRKSRSSRVVPIQEESHSDVESEEDDDDDLEIVFDAAEAELERAATAYAADAAKKREAAEAAKEMEGV